MKKYILSLILLFLATNFIFSIFKFISIRKEMKEKLRTQEETLETLEKKNLELKKRLEFVKSPLFLKEQEEKLLGALSSDEAVMRRSAGEEKAAVDQIIQPELQNYQKWFKLFFH